jgi:sugar (pentulose or hexulose) kinase
MAVENASVEDACPPPTMIATVEPEPSLVAYFQERQPRFRSLYTALKSSFRGEL